MSGPRYRIIEKLSAMPMITAISGIAHSSEMERSRFPSTSISVLPVQPDSFTYLTSAKRPVPLSCEAIHLLTERD